MEMLRSKRFGTRFDPLLICNRPRGDARCTQHAFAAAAGFLLCMQTLTMVLVETAVLFECTLFIYN